MLFRMRVKPSSCNVCQINDAHTHVQNTDANLSAIAEMKLRGGDMEKEKERRKRGEMYKSQSSW